MAGTRATGGRAVDRSCSFGASAMHQFDAATAPTIHAVVTLDEEPDRQELLAFLGKVCGANDRFRSGIFMNKKTGDMEWHPLEGPWELEEIISEVELPGKDCQKELNGVVQEYLSRGFQPGLPYWEVICISYKGLPRHDLLIRISHSIADGITLASLLLSFTEPVNDADAEGSSRSSLSMSGHGRRALWPWLPSALEPLEPLLRAASSLLWRTSVTVMDTLKVLVLPLLPGDPATPLGGGRPSPERSVAVAEFDVSVIKAAGASCSTGKATVNDVLFAAMSSATDRYLALVMPPKPAPARLSALAIFNTRRLKGLQAEGFTDGARFGNDFAYACIPVDLRRPADPMVWIERAKAAMDRAKASGQAWVVKWVNDGLKALLPFSLVFGLLNRVLGKHTLIFSTLMAPQHPVRLAGRRVTRIYNHVNPCGPVRLVWSFLSYNGKVTVGLSAQASNVPDADKLMKCLEDSVEEMCSAAAAKCDTANAKEE